MVIYDLINFYFERMPAPEKITHESIKPIDTLCYFREGLEITLVIPRRSSG